MPDSAVHRSDSSMNQDACSTDAKEREEVKRKADREKGIGRIVKKERRSQFYRNVLKLYCYNCPSNIYTLSDEVIAAVFAINSSASTAARMLGG